MPIPDSKIPLKSIKVSPALHKRLGDLGDKLARAGVYTLPETVRHRCAALNWYNLSFANLVDLGTSAVEELLEPTPVRKKTAKGARAIHTVKAKPRVKR